MANSSFYGRREEPLDGQAGADKPDPQLRASTHHQGVGGTPAANSASLYERREDLLNTPLGATRHERNRGGATPSQGTAVQAPAAKRAPFRGFIPVVCLLVLVVGLGFGFRLYLSGPPSLFALIESGEVAALQMRLSENAGGINEQNAEGLTPLMAAIEADNLEMVEALLAHSADMRVSDSKGCAPVILASDKPAILELLLRQGADVRSTDAQRMSALHWAVRHQSAAAVRLLMQYDAPVNTRNQEYDTPLLIAVKNGFREIDLLLMHGADPHVVDQIGETPLHYAAKENRQHHAEALLTAGAEPVVFSRQGWTPLHTACRNGSLSVAALLLEAKVPVDIENKRRQTPLVCAVLNNQPAIIAYLLECGADLAHVGSNGNTALHLALANQNFEVARMLLEAGADLDVTNNAGLTPRALIQSHDSAMPLDLKNAVSAR